MCTGKIMHDNKTRAGNHVRVFLYSCQISIKR